MRRSPLRIRDLQSLGSLLQNFSPRLGDLNTIDLTQAIINEANYQGVPPSIALSVATVESGIQQWTANGNLVVSSAGAIGVMQLMPATADQLGVDPTDPLQNIQGGISYLAQMYQQFGDWSLALAAYNWGPAKVQRAVTAGGQIPASVQSYVTKVLAGAGVGSTFDAISQPYDPGTQAALPTSSANLPLVLGAVAGTIFFVDWLLGE